MLSNFGYLAILQILSLALPLASYPYLIRVLGPDIYGKVIFAQALMAYFSIVINFGFNISATKDVAENQNDNAKLSEIVSSVFSLKIILWLFCLIGILVLISVVPTLRNDSSLYLLSFGMCFNELFFQQYFFQGIEKMKYITVINAISRIFFFVLIFILVKSTDDYLKVPLLNLLGSLIGGIYALYIIIAKEGVQLFLPKRSVVCKYFKESAPFFLSRISSVVINKTNTILLGSFVGYTSVAFYDLAQKILSVLLIPFDILNQVTYPHIAKTKDMALVKKILLGVLLFSILGYLFLCLLGNKIVLLLGGSDMQGAIPYVLLLCVNVIFTAQTYFLGNTVLVCMGKSRYFNLSVVYTSIIYLILNSVLIVYNEISTYNLIATAILSELFCVGYRYYYVRKFNLLK